MIAHMRRLWRDRRGNAITEFGLLAPVMLALFMGLSDVLYQAYLQSVLNGAVQKAGRDSGIEGGANNTTAIDAKVQTSVRQLARSATFSSSRKSYDSFTEVAPEPFIDTNGNGTRETGECYTDQNANRTWDSDPGTTGQGGANAVALYTMTVTYPRLFPIMRFFGVSNTQTISSSTLLKNQPYSTQSTTAEATVCT